LTNPTLARLLAQRERALAILREKQKSSSKSSSRSSGRSAPSGPSPADILKAKLAEAARIQAEAKRIAEEKRQARLKAEKEAKEQKEAQKLKVAEMLHRGPQTPITQMISKIQQTPTIPTQPRPPFISTTSKIQQSTIETPKTTSFIGPPAPTSSPPITGRQRVFDFIKTSHKEGVAPTPIGMIGAFIGKSIPELQTKGAISNINKSIKQIESSPNDSLWKLNENTAEMPKSEILKYLNQQQQSAQNQLDATRMAEKAKQQFSNMNDVQKANWWKQNGQFKDENGKDVLWKELENKGLILEVKNDQPVIRYETSAEVGNRAYNELVSDYMKGGRSKSDAENLVKVRLASVAFMESPFASSALIDSLKDGGKKWHIEQYSKGLKSGKFKNPNDYLKHWEIQYAEEVKRLTPRGMAEASASFGDFYSPYSMSNAEIKSALSKTPDEWNKINNSVWYDLAIADKGYATAFQEGPASFAKKVYTSGAMVEGVYIPLLTMGIGTGVGGALGYAKGYGLQLVETGIAPKIGKALQIISTGAGLTLGGIGVAGTAQQLGSVYKPETTLVTPETGKPYTTQKGGVSEVMKTLGPTSLAWGAAAYGGRLGYATGYKLGTTPSKYGFHTLNPEQSHDRYRLLSKKYHPDVSSNRYKSGARFREMKSAYDLLGKQSAQSRKISLAGLKTSFSKTFATDLPTEAEILQLETSKSLKPQPVYKEKGPSLLRKGLGIKYRYPGEVTDPQVIAGGPKTVPIIPEYPQDTLVSRMGALYKTDPATGLILGYHSTPGTLHQGFRRRVTLIEGNDSKGYLVMSHSKSGTPTWLLPGGDVKSGETDLQALNRETLEEFGTGIDIKTAEYVGSYLDPHSGNLYVNYEAKLLGNPKKASETTFIGRYKGKEVSPQEMYSVYEYIKANKSLKHIAFDYDKTIAYGKQIRPGAKKLLNNLRNEEYKISLISAGKNSRITAHLKKLGLTEYFENIITDSKNKSLDMKRIGGDVLIDNSEKEIAGLKSSGLKGKKVLSYHGKPKVIKGNKALHLEPIIKKYELGDVSEAPELELGKNELLARKMTYFSPEGVLWPGGDSTDITTVYDTGKAKKMRLYR